MAARPGLPPTPARHGSYLPQKGWFPSRRNALAVLDQAPVLPTTHYEATSSSGSAQWSSASLQRWAMATASIKHGAHKLLGRDHKPATSTSPPVDNEKCQQEKRNIASFYDNAKPLPPDQIADSPRNKDLATSSRNLRIQDFELIKTLGTGTFARLDYCPGGEVFRYLRSAGRFDLNTARFYAAEIVLILEFLHNVQGIAYRDMKPENILIDAEGHLKLVDFGFAKKVETRETYTLCGTPEYLAPEVIRNSGKYRSVSALFEPDPAPWRAIFDSGLKPGHGTAVDWWAFGILVYEFLVGTPPFWDNNPMKIYEKICVGKIKYPSDMDEDARSLISGLCSVNPTQRLGNLTGGVDRVKSHPFFAPIDWEALYYRKIKGPIIPKLRHPADASNFDEYNHPPEQRSVYTKEMAKSAMHKPAQYSKASKQASKAWRWFKHKGGVTAIIGVLEAFEGRPS
ncbi:MAG: hypothetical protein Q9210_002915 [Variospora velana]